MKNILLSIFSLSMVVWTVSSRAQDQDIKDGRQYYRSLAKLPNVKIEAMEQLFLQLKGNLPKKGLMNELAPSLLSFGKMADAACSTYIYGSNPDINYNSNSYTPAPTGMPVAPSDSDFLKVLYKALLNREVTSEDLRKFENLKADVERLTPAEPVIQNPNTGNTAQNRNQYSYDYGRTVAREQYQTLLKDPKLRARFMFCFQVALSTDFISLK